MSVRPFLLKDLKKSAIVQHQLATGNGNYNCWSLLVPRDRSVSVGKRRLSDKSDGPLSQGNAPKAPRFDASVVLGQLKGQETVLSEIEVSLDKISYDTVLGQVLPQQVKDVIVSMGNALNLLLKSQKNLTSVLVDVVKVSEGTSNNQAKVSEVTKAKGKPAAAAPPRPNCGCSA
jgi:hypothetical protein